jgi:hypothetical protein
MTENIDGNEVKVSYQDLPIWTGTQIADTYNNKPVLDLNGEPLFAELFALRLFIL